MVILDGYNLTINNLVKIAHNCEQGKIKKSQWSKIRDAERFIKKQVASNKTVYGFNTGFGALAHRNLALIYRYLFIMFRNSCSDMVFTPSFFAFLYFEPGSLPATTKSVFFDTEDDG